MNDVLQSAAFGKAALRSERIRVRAILAVLAAVLVLVLLRSLVTRADMGVLFLPKALGLVGAFMIYEAGVLLALRRAADRRFPSWFWPLNVFIETLFPTLSLLVLTESSILGPYRALVAPAVLAYFFVITLSTLRLSPSLAALTGLFSALGYAALIAYTFARYPEPDLAVGTVSLAVFLTYAVFLLIGGAIAAGVAGQIRGHVGAALAEARESERMVRDLELARTIQQGLLPNEPPAVEGFDIAGWNRPAEQTGGDYFDWLALPDGRIAVMLADVTGHGIGPALVTAACRAYGRACMDPGADAGSIMDRVNKLLCEDLPPGKLITFALALLDPPAARLQLLSAGHGPLLLYRAAGDRVKSFKAHGIPFGVTDALAYGPAQEIDLAPGDMLVLITDGFFEWENGEGEQFGLDRLAATVREASRLPAAELIARLHSEVTAFAGGTDQLDDLTAVVVKRAPGP